MLNSNHIQILLADFNNKNDKCYVIAWFDLRTQLLHIIIQIKETKIIIDIVFYRLALQITKISYKSMSAAHETNWPAVSI